MARNKYFLSKAIRLILRITHQPTAAVSLHITVDVQCLLAVRSETDCVDTAYDVAFGQQFGAVGCGNVNGP